MLSGGNKATQLESNQGTHRELSSPPRWPHAHRLSSIRSLSPFSFTPCVYLHTLPRTHTPWHGDTINWHHLLRRRRRSRGMPFLHPSASQVTSGKKKRRPKKGERSGNEEKGVGGANSCRSLPSRPPIPITSLITRPFLSSFPALQFCPWTIVAFPFSNRSISTIRARPSDLRVQKNARGI